MAHEIDYTAVLADLEAKRATLDASIAGIRAMLGLAPGEAPTGTTYVAPKGGGGTQEVVPGAFHGMSVAAAVRAFLDMKKTKQRTVDIIEAIQKGGIESTANNFYANVYTTLMRRKEFLRIGKYWALAEWYPNRAPTTKPEKKAKRARRARAAKQAAPKPAAVKESSSVESAKASAA